ncbi:MAG: thrombospondin type 3 repeat-containing protein [Phycisphaerales bacterium]|nr:MAG: thrombospondin type 3 repeat-containing protein [Phycisphaerales bacterium]
MRYSTAIGRLAAVCTAFLIDTGNVTLGQSSPIVGEGRAVMGSEQAGGPTAPVDGTVSRPNVQGAGNAADDAGRSAASTGPDVIIGDLPSVIRFGRVEDITAYAVGTDPCNVGDERVSWIAHTNAHPVWVQGMFRLKDDLFEQIGMSWVRHGFYPLNGSTCGPCLDPTDGSGLGVGCSGCCCSAWLNGVQGNLSLRSDVNAHTGYFPYPWEAPEPEEIIGKRIQVHDADLDPDLNEDALYFVESHHIAADDAAAGNGNNNASYRPVSVVVPFDAPPNTYNVVATGLTQRERAAIRAWKDTDSSVVETDIQVPGEGLFILAAKTRDAGNGFWHYEYALQNFNSDRSAGSFAVPLPYGAMVQNVGFHDVDYHSGEIYDSTDWPATVEDGTITWSTDSYDVNANANALRFDTLYNFRFDANVGPGSTTVMLGLFKPGEAGQPDEVMAGTTGPSLEPIDCNDNDIADMCDIACEEGCEPPCGESVDCNQNGIPDECEPDCNANGVADSCDIAGGSSNDCNENTIPDECEPDCDNDGIPDECDTFEDTDGDGIFDCFDLCPLTTPPGACVCPELCRCCWPSGFCLDDYPCYACIPEGGVPDCIETFCRDGCLIGDYDGDGDRDLRDWAGVQRCYTGASGTAGYVSPSQECTLHLDFDQDDDIDLGDFREWRDAYAGPK